MYNFEPKRKYDMKVIVSQSDHLSAFADCFFDEDEADKLVKFAESLGYKVEVVKTDAEFRDNWSPYRKIMHRDIDWDDPLVIMKIIKMRLDGKSDEQIKDALGSESTGFGITIKRGNIWEEFIKWQNSIQGAMSDEQILAFCKNWVAKRTQSVEKTKTIVKKLVKGGCTHQFPECKDGFVDECLKCPHNGGLINTRDDIDNLNKQSED